MVDVVYVFTEIAKIVQGTGRVAEIDGITFINVNQAINQY